MQMRVLTRGAQEENHIKRLQVDNFRRDPLDQHFTSETDRPGPDGHRHDQGPVTFHPLVALQQHRPHDSLPQIALELHVQLLQDLRQVPIIHKGDEDELL